MALEAPLFPLSLSPFEAYMVADDRPRYPMTVLMAMEFVGEFRPSVLQGALNEVLLHHPLFRSHVVRRRGHGAWSPVDHPSCLIDFRGADAPIVKAEEGFDLIRETGLRLWVRQGGGRAALLMQFHHACADAIGGIEFLGDLLATYAAESQPGGPPSVTWRTRRADPSTTLSCGTCFSP